MFFSRLNTQIGIDIGSAEIRAARICRSTAGLALTDSLILPLGPLSVLQTLQQIRENLAYRRGESIILAVDHEQVIHKTLTLAADLNEHELAHHFKQQSAQWCGTSPKNVAVDYFSQGNTWQVIATKKSSVIERSRLARLAKFKLRAIDVNFWVLPRLHSYLHPVVATPIGILLITARQLYFCVFNHQQLIHTTSITLSSSTVLFYRQQLRLLIQQALQFLNQMTAPISLDTIYLAGSEFLEHLVFLQTEINVPIQPLRLSHIDLSENFDSRLLISLGLALWGLS